MSVVDLARAIRVALHWRLVSAAVLGERFGSPLVRRFSTVPGGVALDIALPPGLDASMLSARSLALAAAHRAREVVVQPDERRADRVRVLVLFRSLLDAPQPLPSPLAGVGCWGGPIPIAVAVDGAVVYTSPTENSYLIGGEPGGGKSVAASQIVAAAALDPRVRLFGIDGKRVELSLFAPVFERLAHDLDDATDLLDELLALMFKRYAEMQARGLRKTDDAFEPILLVIDELALFTAPGGTQKKGGEFSDRLRQLAALGRAAGVCILLSTQKPSSDVVDTSVRDLIRTRWALRCTTPQASDTILGAGRASTGYSAALIPASSRGRGLLLSEGSEPEHVRSFYLSDQDVRDLVELAVLRRRPRRSLAQLARQQEAACAPGVA